MSELIQNYSKIIEKVRKDRKISRDELCEDIMSKRNYQRFATGEISISSDKVFKLVDNLGLSVYEIQTIHKKLIKDEYGKILNAFNLVSQFKILEAEIVLSTIDSDKITSKSHLKLYELTNLIIKRSKDRITESDFYSRIENLIDYPSVLNKKILSIFELNGLFILSKKFISKNDPSIIDFFINIIANYEQNKIWLIEDYMSLVFIYITRGIYHFEKYKECIKFCDNGIEFCRSTSRFLGYENLLAYKSLSLNKIGKFPEALAVAKQLKNVLDLLENKKKKTTYLKIITDRLNISIDDLK